MSSTADAKLAKAAKAALLGLLLGLATSILSISPWGVGLEEELGLRWLFRWRGPRPAPTEVVVVTVDTASAERLGLQNDPAKWPRSLHGRLVRTLTERGARAIAFDIVFDEPREGDELFADALHEARRVVLFEYLKRRTIRAAAGAADSQLEIGIEQRVPPITTLARAAVALAPFPLPKVPVRVSQVWLFKPEAGDAPTLPVVTLLLHLSQAHRALLQELGALGGGSLAQLTDAGPGRERMAPQELAQHLRGLFRKQPALTAALRVRLARKPSAEHADIDRLIDLYAGPNSRYVDFYGPPHSVMTLPYYAVLEGKDGTDLTGKTVFVGFSEQLQPEQRDGFYTVFSRPDGLDLSGVEIAATTFANLLEGRTVQPLPAYLQVVGLCLWGLILALCLRIPPVALALPATVLLGTGWAGLAHAAFARHSVWLPLVAPLLVQLPLLTLSILVLRYREVQHERRNMRAALGNYLPARVADAVADDLAQLQRVGEVVEGVCLCTDAEQYTRLSESMDPRQLGALMNRYYSLLFGPVRRHGGSVSDVLGDAMLALWVGPSSEPRARSEALAAALEIIAGVDRTGLAELSPHLPTRIGLHCGPVFLGSVGAADHYEYRAVGDMVNTADRIQGLNKQLGTRVLASEEVCTGIDGLLTRPLGAFLLVGKTRPILVHEVLCPQGDCLAWQLAMVQEFDAAMRAFREARWSDAAERFLALLARFPADGPTRYYLELSRAFHRAPDSAPTDGVLVIDRK